MSICASFCAGAAAAGALSARLVTGLSLSAAVLAAVATAGNRFGAAADAKQPAAVGTGLRALLGAAFLAGALLASMAWQQRGLPPALDGIEVDLTGVVATVRPDGAVTMRAPINTATGEPRRTMRFYPAGDWPAVTVGDVIRVRGTLVLPRPPGNPGGFDAAVYARVSAVDASVNAGSMAIVEPAPAWRRLTALPAAAGQRAADILSKLFPQPNAALLHGLIFGGDSDQLPAALAADFRRAGLLHLLAASGSNVAFILGAAVAVLRHWVQNRYALAVGLAVVICYWLMTGGGASIGRATLMAVIVIAARLLRRRPDSLTSLAAAAGALTAANPLTVLDAGFQLSFGATWGLLCIGPPLRTALQRRGMPAWLATPLAVTLAAQAGVLPVAMSLFGEQSLVSPLTNLVALPLAGVAVVSGSLCCLLGAVWLPLAVPAAAVTSVALRLLTMAVAAGARVPFATVALPAMPLCWAVAYYIRAAAVGRRRARSAVLPALLGLAVIVVALRPASGGPGAGLRITFIDVRQGDSALVELPDGRRLLVDCGDMAGAAAAAGEPAAFAGPGGRYDAAGRAIVPYLRWANIRDLAAVVITHDHTDHSGGLAGVRQAVRVADVLTSAELHRGQSTDLGGARCDVLWPPAAAPRQGNDASVVLRLAYAGRSALLTGDSESAAEAELVAGSERLAADVLKVAHHGGAGSTGEAFLAAVRPSVAVISVGARNPFGHPSLEALARLAAASVQTLRTDRFGAVRVAFADGVMKVWRWDGRAWRAIALTGTPPPAANPSSHGLHCGNR